MSIIFVDRRPPGQEVELTEVYTIPSSAPYTIRLTEVPGKYVNEIWSGPNKIKEQSSESVATWRFYADYDKGKISFNASQAGLSISIVYKGRGSVVLAEDLNTWEGIADEVIEARGAMPSLDARLDVAMDEYGHLHGEFLVDILNDDVIISENPKEINFTHGIDVVDVGGTGVPPHSGTSVVSVDETELDSDLLPITPSGNVSASTVQSAIYELDFNMVHATGDIDEDVTGTKNFLADVLISNELSLRLYDGTGAYVGLRAPADLDGSGNYTYLMPVNYGVNGRVLTTDGAGNLSWSDVGDIDGSGTPNYVAKFTGSKTIGDSNIYSSGSYVGIGTEVPNELLHVVGGNIKIDIGDIEVTDSTKGIILKSPSKRWRVTIDDSGILSATEL